LNIFFKLLEAIIGFNSVRKVKAHLELNLVRKVKSNRKDFYRYISSKGQIGENRDLLLNGAGDLVTKHMEKAKVLKAAFALVFTGKTSRIAGLETCEKAWRNKDTLSSEGLIKDTFKPTR